MTIFLWILWQTWAGDGNDWLAFYRGSHPRFEPIHVFGAVDETDDFLVRPLHVWPHRDGRVLVLDSGETLVRVFDGQNSPSTTFGSHGEGPGQFLASVQMAVSHDGRIVVYDLLKRRFCWFRADGSFAEFQNFPKFVWKMRFQRDGHLLIETRDLDFSGKAEGTTLVLARYSPDLAHHTIVDRMLIVDGRFVDEPVKTNIPQPFFSSLYWDLLSDDRIVTVRSETFDMRLFSPQGRQEAEHRLQGEMVPVTEEDRREFIANLRLSVNFDQVSHIPKAVSEAIDWPVRKPYCKEILTDGQNHIWALSHEVEDGYRPCSVYDSQGNLISGIRVPAAERIFLHGGRLFTIQSNHEDISQVVEYRPVATNQP